MPDYKKLAETETVLIVEAAARLKAKEKVFGVFNVYNGYRIREICKATPKTNSVHEPYRWNKTGRQIISGGTLVRLFSQQQYDEWKKSSDEYQEFYDEQRKSLEQQLAALKRDRKSFREDLLEVVVTGESKTIRYEEANLRADGTARG